MENKFYLMRAGEEYTLYEEKSFLYYVCFGGLVYGGSEKHWTIDPEEEREEFSGEDIFQMIDDSVIFKEVSAKSIKKILSITNVEEVKRTLDGLLGPQKNF